MKFEQWWNSIDGSYTRQHVSEEDARAIYNAALAAQPQDALYEIIDKCEDDCGYHLAVTFRELLIQRLQSASPPAAPEKGGNGCQ
jgi:hypothetical protein